MAPPSPQPSSLDEEIMKTAARILAATLCSLVVGCDSRHVADPDPWRSQVAKVTLGMPRGEVEKLLPPHPKSPLMMSGTGGSQSVTYWLDEQWCVSLAYDHTRGPGEATRTTPDMSSPQNKVLTKPVLTPREMPFLDVKSLEALN